jgi:hypothetical protein
MTHAQLHLRGSEYNVFFLQIILHQVIFFLSTFYFIHLLSYLNKNHVVITRVMQQLALREVAQCSTVQH